MNASDGVTPWLYRAEKKALQILLSRTQAGPGSKVKQQEEDISRNHVPRLFLNSVHMFNNSTKVLRVFLMNKMESSQAVRIKMPSGAEDLDSVVCMTDSDDHWGTRDTTIPGMLNHMRSTLFIPD